MTKPAGLLLAGLAACARVEVREVELGFAERANASAPDAGSLSGFTCSIADEGALTATPLVRRALGNGAGAPHLRMSLVVQAIEVGDNPGCRDALVARLVGHGALRAAGGRVCRPALLAAGHRHGVSARPRAYSENQFSTTLSVRVSMRGGPRGLLATGVCPAA